MFDRNSDWSAGVLVSKVAQGLCGEFVGFLLDSYPTCISPASVQRMQTRMDASLTAPNQLKAYRSVDRHGIKELREHLSE